MPDADCTGCCRGGLTAVISIAALLLSAVGVGRVHAGPSDARPRRGAVVYSTGFDTPAERALWSEASGARWVDDDERGRCLVFDVPAERAEHGNMIRLPLDVRALQNCRLLFECAARADAVTRPPHAYNGVKYMFHCVSPSQGPLWRNQNGVFGSFDWKRLAFSASVPDDVERAWLCLGLQQSSGKVWFDDLKVSVLAAPLRRPEPDPNAGPAFRGHDLPRLRGVMSPHTFREEDLRVLGQDWRANLIRWQMTTRWGAAYKHPQDYDLELYDRWLDAELDDLDRVLEACRKYGIYVVVDLHSPPGGRRPSRDLVMLHEPVYLAKFVSVWERLAERYKGNPVVWGFDLVNEPVQDELATEGTTHYLEAQMRAARAIRTIDPERTIIIEVDHWDSAEGFKYLEAVELPGVVYQVHMYHPGQFTHQGIHGNPTGVRYPGTVAGRACNKDTLRRHLSPVRAFQLAHNAHIYVGEFSAIRWAPDGSAYRYIRDCIDLFEDYGWDWSYHAYREWDGWSVEHGGDAGDHNPAASPTDRQKLLIGWFERNEKPRW